MFCEVKEVVSQSVGFFISSLIATLLFGVAAGNVLAGIPLDARGEFTGGLLDLVGLYPLATGLLAEALEARGFEHGLDLALLSDAAGMAASMRVGG